MVPNRPREGRAIGFLDRLAIRSFPPAHTNGNGAAPAPAEGKGVSFGVSPEFEFFSPDHTRTIVQLIGGANSESERVSRDTAYAAAAYCHAAVRYRSRKVAEPPLMVVKEDRESGDMAWQPRHPLAGVLEDPAPDYDMAELLARTQTYVDITGSAIWVKDADGLGAVGRLVPFSGAEFQVRQTNRLIRGEFVVQTNGREEVIPAERVVYFHELNPSSWERGLSLVDVALSWLNMGQKARATVKDVLDNALFPSVIIQADPTWNPDEQTFEQYKSNVERYAEPGNRGKPLVSLGGGSATAVGMNMKDLVPGEILNRVEAVVSSVFGVPAVVLQYLVGLQNSPWSQMAEARRMCYEDTIEPLWREYENRLTRQLLRAPSRPGGAPLETDRAMLVRFDTSKVRALQIDKSLMAQIAERTKDIGTVNERRALVGWEPFEGEEYDEPPKPQSMFALQPEDEEEDEAEEGEDALKMQRKALDRKDLHWALFDESTRSQELMWELAVSKRLQADADAAAAIIQSRKSVEFKADLTPEEVRRIIREFTQHMDAVSAEAWRKELEPLIQMGGRRAVERLAAQAGVAFDLLAPGLVEYTAKEAAWLVTQVTDTTKSAIRDALSQALIEGESIPEMAKRIQGSGAFSRSRATLIARTETTRVANGAAVESLKAYGAETGDTFKKQWVTARDDRVRDEHAALDGETVPLGAKFSNGLDAPGEPNCRCTVLTTLED